MKEITICPYCGGEHLEWHKKSEKYYCLGCGNEFTEKDAEFEDVRHELSALIMDTTEENPLKCEIVIGEDDACGLSSLELPWVVGIFQDSDACIWVNIDGMSEPMNFDDLTLNDVKTILDDIKCYYTEGKK